MQAYAEHTLGRQKEASGHARRLSNTVRNVPAVTPLELSLWFKGERGRGSRWRGGARDVDIGIAARPAPDLLDATNRFVFALGVSAVDLVDLNRANPVLQMCVAQEGVPLYEVHATAFDEYASLAMRRYADTKKFRDALREDLRAFAAAAPPSKL